MPNDKKQPSSGAAPGKTTPAAPVKGSTPPTRVELPSQRPAPPPLFRKIDWVALIITFVFMFVAYYLTIAPEMTLEDSGELATGSFYAGIPHPPGYPIWTIFTHLWTLIPIGNVAWRVALASAFGGALAAGMLAFIVSRGSSMIIESIDDLKNFDRRWENAICLVSGFVSGMLIGFNGYMWSQAVIVEVYPLSVASLMGVLLCLLRWIYAPHQRRYLYGAFFLYGICVNNHQSLLVIAMGMEVLVIAADRKVGREMMMWNSLLYFAGLAIHPEILAGNVPVFVIFNTIGIISIALWIWLVIVTKKRALELALDATMIGTIGCVGLFLLGMTHWVTAVSGTGALTVLALGAIGCAVGWIYFIRETRHLGNEWLVTLACGGAWLLGAAGYLYMPIAGATVPPMEWGYPRTLEGFIHAITRGQYEKIHPTSGEGTGIHVITSFFNTYLTQIWRYLEGLNDEFNILFLLLAAVVVFLFYRKMKRRERVWITGLIAIFICLGPFLVLLLNFPSDRQSLELNRVFLTSSHVIISIFAGYGLTLIATYMATHYATSRRIFMIVAWCIIDMSLFMLVIQSQDRFDLDMADWASALGYAKILCWMLAAVSAVIFWRDEFKQDKILANGVPGFFAALSLVPTILALTSLRSSSLTFSGWGDTMSGIADAFRPMHYGLPVIAAFVLLFLGFIFLAALGFYKSRAPLIVTLAVFALMPSYSIFTHWFDNEQRQHWFGYWFGHDMFTPPVFLPDGTSTYDPKVREEKMKGPDGHLVYPEMSRNAILFGGTDPGRFAPTYMIFCDSFIPHIHLPHFDRNFDRRDVYIITQNALADPTYLQYIRSQYYRSDETNYDTPFFQEVLRGTAEHDKFSQYYGTNILARIAYDLLDKPITAMGSRVETRRRKEGVYPPVEIYEPTPEDSQNAFSDYMADAQQRIYHDQTHPNEPREIKPGEEVHVDASGHVQVSGQVAVMAINGLLTKVIFDHNPTNEFYVEESFPLDWMFPNLTPFGIIMKINRNPVPELSDEVLKRDHEFWANYSDRLIGNWITDKTTVKEIADFAERVYMHHDYTGFKGDLKFIRDDDAQKAFSKLRSSIAGVYSWRLGLPPQGGTIPPQFQQYVAQGPNREAVQREADFAFKQAFAFCPYSPEAVYRYVQLLVNLRRPDDALLIAETAQKLDPYNGQFEALINNLKAMGAQSQAMAATAAQLQKDTMTLEADVKAHPTDLAKQFQLAEKQFQLGQADRGFATLDAILASPNADLQVVMEVASAYNQLNQPVKLQTALEKLTHLAPESPEAWYDLAASQASLGQNAQALESLKKSIEFNDRRRVQNPKTNDLRTTLAGDARFTNLRNTPEYKALIAGH